MLDPANDPAPPPSSPTNSSLSSSDLDTEVYKYNLLQLLINLTPSISLILGDFSSQCN